MHGVSVFDAEAAARAQNDKFAVRTTGSPFTHIAALHVPAESSIACDDAFGNRHHWDLFGTPAEILVVAQFGITHTAPMAGVKRAVLGERAEPPLPAR